MTRPLKNVLLFLWLPSSISPLLAYFTCAAAELSLEESGKHQRGMRGISCLSFHPLPHIPWLSLSLSLSLTSRCLRTAGPLEFSLVSERSPTITSSHKQWGDCRWGWGCVAGGEGGGGRPGRVLLAAGLADIPKSPRVEAASSTVRDLRGNCRSAASLKDHKHIFSSFLIYLSTERALMDPTLRGGMLVNVRKPQKYRAQKQNTE